MRDIGCATVMPGLADRLGQGIDASSCIGVIVEQAGTVVSTRTRVPVGRGPGDGVGADAVLANSAVARADDAPAMARAFKLAARSGRLRVHRAAHGHLEDGRRVVALLRHRGDAWYVHPPAPARVMIRHAAIAR